VETINACFLQGCGRRLSAKPPPSGRLNISSKPCVRSAISIQSDEGNRRSAFVRIIENKAGNQQFPILTPALMPDIDA